MLRVVLIAALLLHGMVPVALCRAIGEACAMRGMCVVVPACESAPQECGGRTCPQKPAKPCKPVCGPCPLDEPLGPPPTTWLGTPVDFALLPPVLEDFGVQLAARPARNPIPIREGPVIRSELLRTVVCIWLI